MMRFLLLVCLIFLAQTANATISQCLTTYESCVQRSTSTPCFHDLVNCSTKACSCFDVVLSNFQHCLGPNADHSKVDLCVIENARAYKECSNNCVSRTDVSEIHTKSSATSTAWFGLSTCSICQKAIGYLESKGACTVVAMAGDLCSVFAEICIPVFKILCGEALSYINSHLANTPQAICNGLSMCSSASVAAVSTPAQQQQIATTLPGLTEAGVSDLYSYGGSYGDVSCTLTTTGNYDCTLNASN